MFTHSIDPVLVNLGPFAIRYYGLMYVFGFICAYYLARYLSKKKGFSYTDDDLTDIILSLAVSGILGARIFYVFFYNWGYFAENPQEIIALWKGGLSFHGCILGGAVGLLGLVWFKKKKGKEYFSFVDISDLLVIPLAFGIIFGRIGNFINGELVGTVTSIPWCFYFPGYEDCRHPSQLYASFKNLLIFSSLLFISLKTEYGKKRGVLTGGFIILYGVLRFLVGFYRAPDPQVGYLSGLTLGQWLNIVVVVVGITWMVLVKKGVFEQKEGKQKTQKKKKT